MADRTFVFRVARVEDSFVEMGDDLRQVTAYRDLLWSTHLDNLQNNRQRFTNRDEQAQDRGPMTDE